MKSFKQHIYEKLKVTKSSGYKMTLKEFAKEFPDLTQKLLDNEISRNKIRPQVVTRNYSKPQEFSRPSNDIIDEIISILR